MPSIFPWTPTEAKYTISRKERAQTRESKKEEWDHLCKDDLERSFSEQVDVTEGVIADEYQNIAKIK